MEAPPTLICRPWDFGGKQKPKRIGRQAAKRQYCRFARTSSGSYTVKAARPQARSVRRRHSCSQLIPPQELLEEVRAGRVTIPTAPLIPSYVGGARMQPNGRQAVVPLSARKARLPEQRLPRWLALSESPASGPDVSAGLPWRRSSSAIASSATVGHITGQSEECADCAGSPTPAAVSPGRSFSGLEESVLTCSPAFMSIVDSSCGQSFLPDTSPRSALG